MQPLSKHLSHILWIGGSPDTGKTTIARNLAERHHLQAYHYDQHDLRHHELLATKDPKYKSFLAASLEERWVEPEPEALFQRMMQSFHDRFPLLIEDLIALPRDHRVIVEGFGLLPELLAPALMDPAQALWLVPTEAFKLASMKRRNKPSFRTQVSDPDRVKTNLIRRDQLLTGHLKTTVPKHRYSCYEVDGSRPVDEMTDLVEKHFIRFLRNKE